MGEIPEGLSASPRVLHLVVPAYNPGPALLRFLPALAQALARAGFHFRIQVVDDGSTTPESHQIEMLRRDLAAAYPQVLPVLRFAQNEGKGAAIRSGWARAGERDLLAFVDADGSIPPVEVVRLVSAWQGRDDPKRVVVASRLRTPDTRVRQSWKRRLMGRVFAFWVQCCLPLGLHDTQCGCKVLAAETFARVQPHLCEQRFSFDVELLALLRHGSAIIEEIPIHWSEAPVSTVRLFRDVPAMARSVWQIRGRRSSWPRISI